MSDRTLTATITAVDRASPALKQVATGAETMGKVVNQAGTTAAAGMAKAEAGGGRLRGVYENLRGAGASLGIVLASVGELFGEVARFGAEAQASEERLKTAVESTGASWEDYNVKIEETVKHGEDLAFNKEKIEAALANLTQQVHNTGDAMSLLGVAEDLSRARGIDLESAAQLIGRVFEGNTTILQRYGIIVQQGATAQQALAAVQAQTAGQAKAYGDTTAGAIGRVQNSVHDFLAEVGNHLGPLQTLLAVLPGVNAGGVLVAGAFGRLAEVFARDEVAAQEAATGLQQLTLWTGEAATASAEAEIASGGLLATLGPLGLVAAAAAAAFGIYELVKGHHAEASAAKEADKATQDLEATLKNLNASGSALAPTATSWADTLKAALASIPDQIQKIKDAQTKLTGTSQQTAIDTTTAQGQQIQALETQIENLTIASAEAGKVQQAFNDIITDTGTGAGLAQDKLGALFAQFAKDQVVKNLVAGILNLDTRLGDLDIQANKLKDDQAALANATDRQAAAQASWATSIADAKAATDAATQSEETRAKNLDALNTILYANDVAEKRRVESIHAAALMTGELAHATSEGGKAQHDYEGDAQQVNAFLTTQAVAAGTASAQWGVYARELENAGGIGDAVAKVSQGIVAAFHHQEDALDRVARGSSSAAVQLAAFKEVQGGILANENQYTQQASEYGSQVDAIAKAQGILNQRQAEGQTLTKDQIDFLNGAASATGRLKQGQDDATVSAGILAEQYGANVSIGDQLNASLSGLDRTTGDLTGAIDDLIFQLSQMPGKVSTDVELRGVSEAINDAAILQQKLDGLDGRHVTTVVDNITNTIVNDFGKGSGPAETPGGQLGGVVGYANGGTVRAMLAEAGAEMLHYRDGGTAMAWHRGVYNVPVGTYVDTAPATAARMGGGMTFQLINYGDINGVGQLEDVMAAAARSLRAHFAGMGT